jgi:hypothetical protein
VSLRWLESGTSDPPNQNHLQQALSDGCHILHIVAPSRSLREEEDAAIFLAGFHDEARPLRIRGLVDLLNTAADPPLFCFLTSPPDPRGAPDDEGLNRFARRIVEEAGVQIAAALTHGPVDEVSRFLRAFYVTLFATGQVDVAMSSARLAAASGLDAGLSVLFSQRADDSILDV